MKKLIFLLLLMSSVVFSMEIVKEADTIQTRFLLPKNYERIEYPENSFQTYLRNLKLKKWNSPVLLYNGLEKSSQVYISVIDIPILSQDLIQCADAVIKLRAEYLYENKKYDEIAFNLTNGMRVPFSRFAKGERVKVVGNKTSWVTGNYKKGYGREVFEEYLRFIYTYAGTLSLSGELKKADIKDIEIGDVFIQGGSPGHAVIIIDIAVNKKTGEKIMMLAQSYMPSQELHILKSFEKISPWYPIKAGRLITPEWQFEEGSLKKW